MVLRLVFFLTLSISTMFYFPFPIIAENIPLCLQKKYAALQSFSTSFSQEIFHQESGTTETRSGSLIFQKPLFIKWKTIPPYEELLIVNDSAVWNYIPEDKIAYAYSTKVLHDSISIIQVVTGQANIEKDFTVIVESTDTNLHQLHLLPKEPTPNIVELFLWIHKKTALIQQIKVIDFYGNTNTIAFSNFVQNPTIKRNTFVFTPPKETTVEDLRDQDMPVNQPLLN